MRRQYCIIFGISLISNTIRGLQYYCVMIEVQSFTTLFLLLLQVDECLDNFNFELAVKFCERALDIEPDNVEVLEMAGSVFLETGDIDKAKSVSFKFDVCS